MLRTALALLLFATVASAEDSPLVALAKRSNRAASKTVVITNETLAASKGRISDTEGDAQNVQTTAAPAPASATPKPERTASAQATPKPVAPKPATPPYPARTAGAVAPSAEYSLPSTARNIEPQSSATLTQPQSTVRNVEPTSTVQNVQPQSTARTIEPQTTVRNIEPQSTNTPPQ